MLLLNGFFLLLHFLTVHFVLIHSVLLHEFFHKTTHIRKRLVSVVSYLHLRFGSQTQEVFNKFVSGCRPDEVFRGTASYILKAIVEEHEGVLQVFIDSGHFFFELLAQSTHYDCVRHCFKSVFYLFANVNLGFLLIFLRHLLSFI